jgi:carboxyl-terminal processing protease
MAVRARWLALFLILPIAWATPALRAAEPKASEKPTAEKQAEKQDLDDYELYKIIAETMYQVEQNYVKKIDRRVLAEAAIKGMLGELDPYSNYISPEEISRFKTSVESQFGGIGIQVGFENRQLKVTSPLVGSPAYRAGIQAGDVIVEIEGKSTAGITSLDDAVKQLKGEAGTSVTITVLRPKTNQRETLTIDREIIHVETVMGDTRKNDDSWNFMLDPAKKIGYIRITAFSRDTARDLERAMRELKKEGLRGLIIDLRFNPGGLLKSATDIADLFVSDGVIVSTAGRNTPERKVVAKKAGTYEGFPMAVLVNRYSASASEIVSACLQDHHRATIIGERTWGKGSVQNVIDLEGGKSALKLTTAGYKRPNGKNIHRDESSKETDEWGVMPDKGYELKLPDQELSALVRYRYDRDILLVNHHKPTKTDSDKKGEEPKDEEAKAGEKPAKSKANPEKTSPEAKPEGDKASETKKPDEKKPAETNPMVQPVPVEEKKGEQSKGNEKKPATDAKKPAFVDRQLQKAVEYLDTELAKAN